MAELIISTSSNGQFTGSTGSKSTYKGEIKLDVSVNHKTKKYTITVKAVRSFCTYSWAFRPYIKVDLGTSSSNAVLPSSATRPTVSSGYYYNTSGGWGNWSNNISNTLTVDMKPDGSCPTVYLRYQDYTGTVKWGSTNQTTTCSYAGNIATAVQNKTGKVDLTVPQCNLSVTDVTTSSISVKANNTGKLSCAYTFTIDGKSAVNVAATTGDVKATFNKLTAGDHTIAVNCVYAKNGLAKSATRNVNNSNPSFVSKSLTPSGTSKIVYSFKSNYICKYELKRSGNSTVVDSGTASTITNRSVTVSSTSDKPFTLKISRTDYPKLSATVELPCDNQAMDISSAVITNYTSATQARASVTANYAAKYYLNNGTGEIYIDGLYGGSNVLTLPLSENSSSAVTLTARRAYEYSSPSISDNVQLSYDTRKPDITNVTYNINSKNNLDVTFNSNVSLDTTASIPANSSLSIVEQYSNGITRYQLSNFDVPYDDKDSSVSASFTVSRETTKYDTQYYSKETLFTVNLGGDLGLTLNARPLVNGSVEFKLSVANPTEGITANSIKEVVVYNSGGTYVTTYTNSQNSSELANTFTPEWQETSNTYTFTIDNVTSFVNGTITCEVHLTNEVTYQEYTITSGEIALECYPVFIYVEGTPVPAVPYVYNDNQWKLLRPYLYDEDGDEKGWKSVANYVAGGQQ